MQVKTLKAMALLEEIDALCHKARIPYIPGGTLLRAVCESKIYDFPKAEMFVRLQDMDALRQAIADADMDGRVVEDDGLAFRYVDVNTTYLDFRELETHRAHGIRVEVEPLIGEEAACVLAQAVEWKPSASRWMVLGSLLEGSRGGAALEDESLYTLSYAGQLAALPPKVLEDTERVHYAGTELSAPKAIDGVYDALFGAESERVFPSYPEATTLCSVELPYVDFIEGLEGYGGFAKTIPPLLGEIDSMNKRVEEENAVIEGHLSRMRELYGM